MGQGQKHFSWADGNWAVMMGRNLDALNTGGGSEKKVN